MSNWTNDIIVGPGEMPIFRFIPIQRFNRTICSALGIPLNLLVVVVILRSRQLWSTRHISWLAVSFFNLLALAQSVTELALFYLYRRADDSHATLCKMYSFLVGYPYALLLTGLVLASWDRYLALAHLQFYQNYATPRNINLVLVLVFLVITGGQTIPYWLGILPKCGVNYGWMSLTLSFQCVLSILCLVIQLKLFIFLRNCIRYTTSNAEINTMELVPHPLPTIALLNGRLPNSQSPQDDERSNMNKLELRAARTLGFGIFPFCLVTFVLCVTSVGLIVCRVRGQDGFWLWVVMVILREFLLIHLVYIPAVFIINSREFRGAVQRFCRKKRPQPTAQIFG